MEWQPIETAPKDGTDILLGFANDNRPAVVAVGVGNNPDTVALVGRAKVARWYAMPFRGWYESWDEYDSLNAVKGCPTHWMPLPEAPK